MKSSLILAAFIGCLFVSTIAAEKIGRKEVAEAAAKVEEVADEVAGPFMEMVNSLTGYASSCLELVRLSLAGVPFVGIIAKDEKKFHQYVSMSWMLMLPTMIALIGHFQGQLQEWWKKKLAKLRNEHIRDLIHFQSSDYYFNLRRDNKNHILQKAIFLHLGRRRDVKYNDGQFRLMQNSDKRESWEERTGSLNSRSAADLKKFSVNTIPPASEWTEIEPKLYMMHWDENVDGGVGETRTKHTLSFRTRQKNGDEVIEAFIQKCYKEYIEKLKAEEDKARYMYSMQLGIKPKSDDEGTAPPVFKKYKLSEDKSFDSLFFPEKQDVLQLVDDFQESKGKFAIEGFPKKLGLLLYGPPGTGKTSLVKALATHTNRHIVAVPLGKITTNQELYDIMFERVFPCLGDDGVAQQLAFDEVIFLMEEVDAATDIVKTRKTSDKQKSTIAASQSRAFEAACAEDEEDDDAFGMATEIPPAPVVSLAAASDAAAASAAGFDTLGDLLKPDATPLYESADKLDLAGLLNILDGVVDSPGRIVIMTTNHPEKLDAALIRPGRINRQLYLGYMERSCIQQMVVHHYGKLTKAQEDQLETALKAKELEFAGDEEGFQITPAEVEQLCAESDEFDDFIGNLSRFGDLTETFDFKDY